MIHCIDTLQFAEVRATIKRADGSKEDLGVIDSYESFAHKASRWLRKAVAIVGLAALAYGIASPHHGVAGVAPAATVIVNGGQAIVTNLVSGIGGTVPKFIAWGTGAGTAAVADTTLFSESAQESRTSGTVSRVTTTVANDTYQVVGTITVATAGKTITNVGLFDVVTSSSGNLYFKSDFTGLALNVGDSITFTIQVKFS